MIGMAAEYAAAAGNQKVEFLDLAWPQIDRIAGHIRIGRAKQRGKKRGEVIGQIEITPHISALLNRLDAVRENDCLHVFPNRSGNAYTQSGFKAMWQKLMVEALKKKVIRTASRFTTCGPTTLPRTRQNEAHFRTCTPIRRPPRASMTGAGL